MSRPTVYFAHPMSDYGSDREARCVEALRLAGYEVVNPNGEFHSAACQREKDLGGSGMGYFVELARQCDAVAFLPFHDGRIGAGVALEVDEFVSAHDGSLPCFELVDSWAGWDRERRVLLRPVPCIEERSRILGVDGTRRRVRAERDVWSKDKESDG